MPQTIEPGTDKSEPIAAHNHEQSARKEPHPAFTASEREQIARRARAIWREEGCPQGRDRAHWEMAELQVLKARGAM